MSAEIPAHPYAESWPLLGAEDAADLAEDIRANGLRDPIVTYQGMILDGRNRYAGCLTSGTEARFVEFEGDDDAALAFVQSANNSRRHQSKGSLAASWALSMLAARKRKGGRWVGWARSSEISPKSEAEKKAQFYVGVIADHAPALLTSVRDDDTTLNAAYESACEARDEEGQRKAREAREAQEESDAEEFIRANAPDLAEQAQAAGWSWTAARTEWERRNREEAERLRKERAAEERQERERLDGIKRDVNRLRNFLDGLSTAATLHQHPYRTEVLDGLDKHDRARVLRIEQEATWPTTH